jgi:hypothetical protein
MTQYEKDLAAVKQNCCALQYVKQQTDEICLAAVKQYGCALKYVKQQTDEICLAAVNKDGYALVYVNSEFKIDTVHFICNNKNTR